MKYTVLLADGDAAVRRMLCRVLAEEDYRVLGAGDGHEVLRICQEEPIDLVLLDLSLTDKDGWEILNRLSHERPLVPIILVASQPNQLIRELAFGVGALMEKPLDLTKLLQTIHELLTEPIETRKARAAGRSAALHCFPQNSNAEIPASESIPATWLHVARSALRLRKPHGVGGTRS
jgi:DNA-binding response OmpR family regulator